MACCYREYRGCGYIQTLYDFSVEHIASNPDVKNKDEFFSEARLEMIPYWRKKRGEDFR